MNASLICELSVFSAINPASPSVGDEFWAIFTQTLRHKWIVLQHAIRPLLSPLSTDFFFLFFFKDSFNLYVDPRPPASTSFLFRKDARQNTFRLFLPFLSIPSFFQFLSPLFLLFLTRFQNFFTPFMGQQLSSS